MATTKTKRQGGKKAAGRRSPRTQPKTPNRSQPRTQRPHKRLRANLFGIRADQDWYGVATVLALVEAQGRERRVRVGGLRQLYRRPAQRPRHKLTEHTSDREMAKLLSAFGHPQRVAIAKAIYAGAHRYASLRESVDLKAGPMYHHLRELRLAGVLADGPRDAYELTDRGRDAVIVLCSLASLWQDGAGRS